MLLWLLSVHPSTHPPFYNPSTGQVYTNTNSYSLFVPSFPGEGETKKHKSQDFLLVCARVWVCLCVRKRASGWWEMSGCDARGSIRLWKMHKGKVKAKKDTLRFMSNPLDSHTVLPSTGAVPRMGSDPLESPLPPSQACPYLGARFSWTLGHWPQDSQKFSFTK